MTAAFNVLQAAAGRSPWDDSWDCRKGIPAATTPDPDDLTHAAHRIRADLAITLDNLNVGRDVIALIVDRLACELATGTVAPLGEGLTAWLEDVVTAVARAEG